jgi:hypothetical protein
VVRKATASEVQILPTSPSEARPRCSTKAKSPGERRIPGRGAAGDADEDEDVAAMRDRQQVHIKTAANMQGKLAKLQRLARQRQLTEAEMKRYAQHESDIAYHTSLIRLYESKIANLTNA